MVLMAIERYNQINVRQTLRVVPTKVVGHMFRRRLAVGSETRQE